MFWKDNLLVILILLIVVSVSFAAACSFVHLICMVHITVSFLKLFILKREQKDGVVGLLARIMLKIISFTLLSVVDFMHKLGQATYFSVSQFPVWQNRNYINLFLPPTVGWDSLLILVVIECWKWDWNYPNTLMILNLIYWRTVPAKKPHSFPKASSSILQYWIRAFES